MEVRSFDGTANGGPGFTSIGWDAVNEATGEIYVVDAGANAVDRFNREGEFEGKVTGFSFGGEYNSIAVDNSGGANEGRVYVAQESGNILWAFEPSKFTPSGEAASTAALWTNTEGLVDLCGVAVDPSGNVWIGDYVEGVQKRDASTGAPVGGFAATDNSLGVAETTAIAFDASSNLYVESYHGNIYKYASGEYNKSVATLTGSAFDVAADMATGHVYTVNGGTEVIGWRPSGSVLFGGPFDTATNPRGITVDGAAGLLYVTNGSTGKVQVYTLPQPQFYTLNVLASGKGSVSAGSGTIAGCKENGGTCSGSYEGGDDVTLTATADEGSTFMGWSGGGCSGAKIQCEVTISAATTVTAAFAQSPPCPNAQYRTGYSATLPDCRAYEMVTPVDKNGGNVQVGFHGEFASSVLGDKIEFPTRVSLSGSQGSGEAGYITYVASRGADGWSYVDLSPTPALNEPLQWFGGTHVFEISEDFSRAVEWAYELPGMEGGLRERRNFYLESAETGKPIEVVTASQNQGKEGEPSNGWLPMTLGSGSSDLGVATFQTNLSLIPGLDSVVQKVYALEHKVLKLVGVLPDGSVPSGGSEIPYQSWVDGKPQIYFGGVVSRDGSRIPFYSPAQSSEQQLYLRKNGTSTVLVSESETGTATTAQNVQFERASADDKEIAFSTASQLTASDPGGAGSALYLYTDGPDPKTEQNLTFIARINGNVEGMSEDGTHIYFSSSPTGVLPSTSGERALYLWDQGQIHQIAPEAGMSASFQPIDYGPETLDWGISDARVSTNGRVIVFLSSVAMAKGNQVRLSCGGGSGIENLAKCPNGPSFELYRYDESTDRLTCVSCPEKGVVATGGAFTVVENSPPPDPAYEDISKQPRFSSDDGRYVFFDTAEALVPQDTNGMVDTYEYDAVTGKVSLLSPGTGEYNTWFADASSDGSNVFLVTRAQLSPWDTDKLFDLYDARVGGGFPGPPAVKPACTGDECQGVPLAPPAFGVASQFSGAGNLTSAAAVGKKALPAGERLKRALAACRRRRGSARRRCQVAARRRYRAGASAHRHVRRVSVSVRTGR